MLAPDSRATLLDMLRPPAGYELSMAVATTYSLRLEAALVIPAVLAGSNGDRGDDGREPVGLLAALKRLPDRFTIFHQAGQIPAETRAFPLLACLESSVVPVALPAKQKGAFRPAFHPKVWVVRYDAITGYGDGAARRYRILCASRNLTWDRSWDTLAVLESSSSADVSGPTVDVDAIADLLVALPGAAVSGVSRRRADEIRTLADEIRGVAWPVPTGFTGGRFHVFGLGASAASGLPFPDQADHLVVVSPFLRAELLERLPAVRYAALISREDEIARCAETAKDLFDEAFVLDTAAVVMPVDGGDIVFDGLHAKLFLFDVGRETQVFTGSANATVAAFQGNCEVVLELTGPKKRFGVDRLLDFGSASASDSPQGAAEARKPVLRDFLVPVDLDRLECEVADETVDAAAEAIERLRQAVGHAAFTATVSAVDDGRWSVEYAASVAIDDVAGVRWSCRPASLRSEDSVDVEPDRKFRVTFLVDEIEISAFLVHELSIDGASASFVTVAGIAGGPDGRINRVLLRLVESEARLMNLIELLLGDDGSFDTSSPTDDASRGAGSARRDPTTVGLLERLVRALGTHPSRVIEVDDLLAGIGDDQGVFEVEDDAELARLRGLVEPIAAIARQTVERSRC